MIKVIQTCGRLSKRICRAPQCAASRSGTVSSTFLNISDMPLGSRRQCPIGSSFTPCFQMGDRPRKITALTHKCAGADDLPKSALPPKATVGDRGATCRDGPSAVIRPLAISWRGNTRVHAIDRATVRQKKTVRAMGLTLYDVRPHACASIFHASPCFENVYARVPVRATV